MLSLTKDPCQCGKTFVRNENSRGVDVYERNKASLYFYGLFRDQKHS